MGGDLPDRLAPTPGAVRRPVPPVRQGGIYWRGNGWHLPAVLAQVLGMGAAALWINSPAFVGPLSSRTEHSDFSIFLGITVAGLVYWSMAHRSVPAEIRRRPVPAANADTALIPAVRQEVV